MDRVTKVATNKKERAILSNIKTVMVVSLPGCITDHVPSLQHTKERVLSETVIVVDDVEKVSTLPMNEQQIVERFFEIGSKRREILASRAKTPQPGLDRRRLSVDYNGTSSSPGHLSRHRSLSRDSSVSSVSSWHGSNSSLYSDIGSVGGCSNNQLEPNQKEWIYKTAIGDLDAVTRLLLQDRSLVKYKDFVSGYTGLHWACKLGRLDMVHVLIAADSDINARAFNGMTPLHMAAQCGYDNIIDVLIKEKADKLTRDNNGKYPVFYLPRKTPDKIKELLSPPPPPSAKPRRNESFTQGIRRRLSKSISSNRSHRKSMGTPRALTRRPSTSSLDDALKRTRRDSSEGDSKNVKQYMSGIKLLRSSFRSKKAGPPEKLSPTGFHESLPGKESPTKFVRPRPLVSSKSASLPPIPPLSRSYKHLRASFRSKKTKSANAIG